MAEALVDRADAPVVPPFWRRRVFLLAVAAAVLTAGVVAVVVVTRTPGPVEVVRQYFAAIRERDVDKALRAAGVERPTGESAALLVPEALADDWEVVDIVSNHEGSRKAWVDVTLPMYPESEAEQFRGGRGTATATVMLTKDDSWGGRWRISNPFSWTLARGTPLRYFEVNGKTVKAWAPADPRRRPQGTYVMLPGVYTFYRTVPTFLSFEPVKLTLLPGAGGGQPVVGPAITLTPQAHELVRQQAHAYLDRCASRFDLQMGTEPCPFGVGWNTKVETADGEYKLIRYARWKILRYPTLSVSTSDAGILIEVTRPGAVRLTGTAFHDGDRVSFTAQCEVGDFFLVAGLVSATELRLERPDKGVGATCRRPVR